MSNAQKQLAAKPPLKNSEALAEPRTNRSFKTMKLIDNPQAYAIMGCAMRVHSVLGCGFLESTYGDALEIEFAKTGIPYVREDEIKIFYNGLPLKTTFRADFTCFDWNFIVELKAIKTITAIEQAQIIHYMKATGIRYALLINFANPQLQYDTFDAEELKRPSNWLEKGTPINPRLR